MRLEQRRSVRRSDELARRAGARLAPDGVFFLIDAAPLHWFAPGIYESSPTPVAAYISAAAKTAGFALLLRFFSFLFVFAHEKWIHVWGGAAIVSLLWGNIAALRQTNVKRLLAYGAVAQTGFILLGLVAGSEAGFSGMMYYLGVYVFMTAGAFGILIVLEQCGNACTELGDLDGLYRRSPAAALLLLVFMMSLAGVPPTAGFTAKYYIVKALLRGAASRACGVCGRQCARSEPITMAASRRMPGKSRAPTRCRAIRRH